MDLGVSKFMVNLGFARENLMCKLSSNYMRDGQENMQLEYPLQNFSIKAWARFNMKKKGKGPSWEISRARERQGQHVWGALKARERPKLAREKGEKKCAFSRRERGNHWSLHEGLLRVGNTYKARRRLGVACM